MRSLKHLETLLYYDGSQLFLAEDQVGQNYICVLVERDEKFDRYMCVPSSSGKINSLRTGEVDLYTVYDTPEIEEYYVVEASSDLQELRVTHTLSNEAISNHWFPAPGLFLPLEEISDVRVVQDAQKRHRAIIHARLNPPEARDDFKISVEHLAEAVSLIQRLVKYAYQIPLRELDRAARELISDPKNYELEVFAFSQGSFTVHMQSALTADLVGYVQLSKAMDIIDSVNILVDQPEMAVDKVAQYGGHFASTYKSVVEFIKNSGTGVEYEWSMPAKPTSSRYRITTYQAKPIYEEMTKRIDIGVEEKTLTGRFTKLDKKLNKWRLVTSEENKEFYGSSDINLSGLIIDSQIYILNCEERLGQYRHSKKEHKELVLISYKPLQSS